MEQIITQARELISKLQRALDTIEDAENSKEALKSGGISVNILTDERSYVIVPNNAAADEIRKLMIMEADNRILEAKSIIEELSDPTPKPIRTGHNNPVDVEARQEEIRRGRRSTLSDEDLKRMYLDENKSVKQISDETGLEISGLYKRVKQLKREVETESV